MDILRVTEIPMKDESIEYEFHEYDPITQTNLDNQGEIIISIQRQDLFAHPHESYLVIKGKLMKNDDTFYTDADHACLTNDALIHLFTNIKYQLSGQEIESVFYHRQATTMLGLLRYLDDFSKSQGLNQLWYKDSSTMVSTVNNAGFGIRHGYLIESSDQKGTFSCKVPL